MKTAVTNPDSERSQSIRELSSTRGRSSLNNINTYSARNMLASATRRRSSNSEATTASDAARVTLFCPRPKRGFFYSRAYKEHQKKRKEKKREHSDDGSNFDEEIPLSRDLTRRKRNSFFKKVPDQNDAMEPTNVTAYLAARVESEKPIVAGAGPYDHSAALFAVSLKGHMMDIVLVGKDDVPVKAARFILACYSPVLEEIFFKGRVCAWSQKSYDEAGGRLAVEFCNERVLAAAVHHCFSGELPADFNTTSPSEQMARDLAQLDHLAYVFKFSALGEVTYRALRKLINKRVVLSCAIFDELSYREGAGAVDSIKRYALDSMREMPMDTLLAGGVQWMKEESVEAIMQDQDMDVDEFYMFKILNAWAYSNPEERVPVARRLSDHIELKFIEQDLLETQVRPSTYFTDKKITEAVNLIKNSLADRDPSEMERVLVEGAGTGLVNGIYCRVEEDIGIGEEEYLFVKEADDGYSDVGLYLWGTKWSIAMCADYSNCFYSCEDDPCKSSTELVPTTGWGTLYNGEGPPPYCTYLPITRMSRSCGSLEKSMMAPNLEEMMDPTIAEKRRSGYFDKRTDDVMEKRTFTLQQMMHLPEDRKEIRDSP